MSIYLKFAKIKTLQNLSPRSPNFCMARVTWATGDSTLSQHTSTCPAVSSKKTCVKPSKCPTIAPGSQIRLVRGLPPKVRMVFIPDEWFLFMQSKTGVSGLYVLMFVLANYLVSKEIYVMEHEYYSGLSIFVMVAVLYKKAGPALASGLDRKVDEVINAWEESRKMEIDDHKDVIKSAKDAQWRAQGQSFLIDAKKENVAMQLEAAFRERTMHVFDTVKDRLDYQVKLYKTDARIKHKWMVEWILENVRKSITPEFQKQALDSAIRDLAALAVRVK